MIIIKETSELLANVQEAYVALTGIGLFIVSPQGEYLTTVSGIDPVTEYMFIKEESSFRQQIHQLVTNSTTLKFNIFNIHVDEQSTDLQVMLVPINEDGKVLSYIVSSIFVEESSKQNISTIFNDDEWGQSVTEVKVFSRSGIEEVSEALLKMAGICKSLLMKKSEENRFNSLQKILCQANQESLHMENLFAEVYANVECVDLLCYVHQNRNSQWNMEFSKGKNEEKLSSLKLEMISPILNKVCEKGEYQYIENIQFEPRLSLFYSLQIKPRSIYFFPIKNELETKEVIILISETKGKLSLKDLQTIDVINGVLAVYQEKRQLQSMGFHHLTKISRVLEMSKLMTDIKDVQELLFLILEMSDHLIKNTFATIVLKDQTYECIYSEHLTKEQTDAYIVDVSKKLFKNPVKIESYNRIRSFPFGTMIECPIVIDHQIEAILCVKTDNLTKEIDAYSEILANLLSVGLSKFVGTKKEQSDNSPALHVPESIISLLTNRENEILQWMLKGYNNQEIADVLFISAHTVKNHISNIFQKLNITDRRQLFSTIYQLQFYT